MKLNMLLLAMLLAPAVHAEPFISEYVEGSSNNKALEIYNPADVALDLTGYSIKVFSNGAITAGKTVPLSGTLAAKSTLVLTDTGSAAALAAKSNMTFGTSNFNGDDAIALYKGADLIDVFGQIGVDPGTSWGSNNNFTHDRTLVRKSSVVQGDVNGSDAFDPSVEWDFYAKDEFANLGSHSGSGTGGGGGVVVPPVGPVIGNCGDSATLISAVQGAGAASPEAGKTVVVEAVVSRVTAFATGFYIQEEASDSDNNPATSEGIFVYNDAAVDYPSVGDKVRVIGKVEEYFTKTQIRRTGLAACGTATPVQPVSVTLPIGNLNDWESLESMQVTFPQQLVVADHYNLGTYGELTLAPQRLFTPTNQFRPGTPEAVALASQNSRSKIVLDDLVNGKNPANIIYPAPGLNMNNPVRVGDAVNTNLSGILDYSFSAWRLLPAGTVQFTANNLREEQPVMRNLGNLKVTSANVLNYFNGDGLGGGFPTSRGASTAVEFERQADKIVAALSAINADVVGLMEIENDGYGSTSAIVDLVSRLNQRLGAGTYQFVQVPGSTALGTDAISVGMLYKPAKVTPLGNAVTTSAGVFGFGNRQPLVQSFTQKSNNEVFTFAVNHFKSKGSCPSGSSNPDRDLKDGQSCWNATRVQAANELTAWLATNPTGSADKDVLIMGDLNAYAKEDPIHTLVGKGFVNLVEKFQGNRGYSYLFGGESGYLDHALASSTLSSQVTYAMEWHINADETTLFDYNMEDKTAQQQADFYQPTAFRGSDHDPVVVELALKAVNPADLDKDGDVDNNDIALFNALLKSGVKLGLEYDFNKDRVVSSSDARAMATLCTYARCAIK
ncbi:ExeM/NucH family extracellular endonuclease [Rheinheimera tilapiae]|uniref:ExeM/NucH family extracellular endonuclease n=1 Tax=Rheinheimera tilapiae TaxID=875043 RepID=A0ABV6BE75_9GAMM